LDDLQAAIQQQIRPLLFASLGQNRRKIDGDPIVADPDLVVVIV
jgi:hypothetical protein